MKNYIVVFFLLFLGSIHLNAQEKISGFILDSLSGKPLSGAVIYFNATSLGVVTNEKGYFELQKPEGLVSPLVISFLGYEKIILQEPFPEDAFQIKMLPALNWLDSVNIEGDVKNVEKKREKIHTVLALEDQNREWYFIFRRIFLGAGEATEETIIKNIGVFDFKYDPETKIVYVSAKEPIIIENEYLKYQISYNLDSFWFQLTWNGFRDVPSSYSIAGTSFFTDLLDPEDMGRRKYRRTMKRRETVFLGSSLHFMRLLARHKLDGSKFYVYTLNADYKELSVNFSITENEKYAEVFPPPKFYVEYRDQVTVIFPQQESFKIDEFGNFYPWNALKFEGHMGNMGMSSAVPLNFNIQK